MNEAYQIGSVGLASQQKALDTLASNIANINTPGFKRADVRFSELLTHAPDELNPTAGLTNTPQASGVTVRTSTAFDDTGEIKRTGKSMDLAIDGAGFIELIGPRGQALLWRGGTLKTLDDGFLATEDGIALRALINVPRDAEDLRIDMTGAVSARLNGSDQSTHLGDIELVSVADITGLEALDGGLYAVRNDSQIARLAVGEGKTGMFVQGAIEQSNVHLNDEMIRLMIVQRSFAANAQVVQAADQLASITNGLRR